MAKHRTLDGLIKWSQKDEWAERFDEVWDRHYGQIFDDYRIDHDRLEELIGADNCTSLWECAFEDFLTQPIDDKDDTTIVDDYLKRRGWKETATNRRTMEALRDSLFSLYEVSEVIPGQSMLLTDLLRGGVLHRVTEQTSTRALQNADRIGGRVLEVSGKVQLAGGLLKFNPSAAARVLEEIGGDLQLFREDMKKQVVSSGDEVDDIDPTELAEYLYLFDAAPQFSHIWIEDALSGKIEKADPPRFNGDGDELLFHTISYPFTPGVSVDAVSQRLTEIPELLLEDEHLWNWTETPIRGAALPAMTKHSQIDDDRLHIALDDGTPVLATVQLHQTILVLSANSKPRADRAKVMLKSVLKGMLGQPQTQVETYEVLLSSQAEDDVDPEGFLDDMLGNLLDEPLPELGGLTPRAAAGTEEGRRQVAGWLEKLEKQMPHSVADLDYDLGWMWDELGVAELRKKP